MTYFIIIIVYITYNYFWPPAFDTIRICTKNISCKNLEIRKELIFASLFRKQFVKKNFKKSASQKTRENIH